MLRRNLERVKSANSLQKVEPNFIKVISTTDLFPAKNLEENKEKLSKNGDLSGFKRVKSKNLAPIKSRASSRETIKNPVDHYHDPDINL